MLSYIFDDASAAFLSDVAVSGNTFKFLKSAILLPAEWTAARAPTYHEDATGFLVGSPASHSLTIHMISQVTICLHALHVALPAPGLHACFWQLSCACGDQPAQDKFTGVPPIGIRFDYEQTGPYSQNISLYFTDFKGKYPAGLPVPNLAQQVGGAIDQDGNLSDVEG